MTVTQLHSDEDLASVVATRVRELLAGKNLKQGDLARVLGKSQASISDRLRGVKDFEIKELPVLAAMLGVSIEYLLGLTNDRSPRQETGASEVVRHQGLEPRTRWLMATAAVVLAFPSERVRAARTTGRDADVHELDRYRTAVAS